MPKLRFNTSLRLPDDVAERLMAYLATPANGGRSMNAALVDFTRQGLGMDPAPAADHDACDATLQERSERIVALEQENAGLRAAIRTLEDQRSLARMALEVDA